MQHLILKAQNSQKTAPSSISVQPQIPILYFGNLPAYMASKTKFVTVALNPSNAEFPTSTPYLRFPGLTNYSQPQSVGARNSRLQSAYNAYFSIAPYTSWFANLEQVLSGFDASFYGHAKSTALHTDLMSPVATNPTWSKLGRPIQNHLADSGVPLWHDLIDYLTPDVMLISVAKMNFKQVSFRQAGATSITRVIPGKNRYPLQAHTVLLTCGKATDVIYTTPAQVPFGFLKHVEKASVASLFRLQLANW